MDQFLLESLRVVALPTETNFRGVTVREIALIQGVYRTEVAVNGTIPALNDEVELERIVDSYPGVTTFKIKVGSNAQEDIARINIIRSLRPRAKIRLDANGLLSVDQTVSLLQLAGEIEYIEQPCATLEELRELKKRIDVKIVGDEVLRKAKNPFAVDLEGAIDYLMLKVQPLGGIARAHQLAEHHKLSVVVSSALESAVGINYGLILAASFESMKFDCGLGTGSLLAKNVADLPIVDGKIQISEVVPHLEGLDVAADRFEWWKNRSMRTAELLK